MKRLVSARFFCFVYKSTHIPLLVHRLLAAIGKFIFLAPQDTSSVANLLAALDIKTIIEEKKTSISSSKVLGMGRDICELVKSSSTE
jgi:hypothetical protein